MSKSHTSLLVCLVAMMAWSGTATSAPQEKAGPRVASDLKWYEGAVVPGRTANLGVIFDVQAGWHIQSGKNPGDEDTGYIQTTIDLKLPSGWKAGAIQWPEPSTFELGQGEFKETLRGYGGRFVAVIPVQIPDTVAPGEHAITAEVGYQACDDMICEIPASIEVSRRLSVVATVDAAGVSQLEPELARLFEKALARGAATTPSTDSTTSVPAAAKADYSGVKWWVALAFILAAMVWMTVRTFAISRSIVTKLSVLAVAVVIGGAAGSFVRGMTAASNIKWVHYSNSALQTALDSGTKTVLVKFTAGWCANCHVNERIIAASDEAVSLLNSSSVVPLKADLTSEEAEGWSKLQELGSGGIPFIAVWHPGESEPVKIRGQLVSPAPVIEALRGGGISSAADNQMIFDFLGSQFTVAKDARLFILFLAFIAGFFMNFTPCVLPVVPLKILSLQAHAKNPARCLALGLVFGLGIVAMFAVLGLFIAVFKLFDWGEMFGKWWFAALIGAIVGFMGLGMLGLFSIRLPQFVYVFSPQSDSVQGSFGMGVFTAVLSTPCTGPLLGATIAWLLLQPPWLGFSTFVTMGIGMAFPYVLLTARPSWLERLPRTGPGSELVKQVMGLLLMAVASFFVGIAFNSFGA